LPESETSAVFSVFALLPNLPREELAQQRVGASWEIGEAFDVFWGLEVISANSNVKFA